MGDFPLADLLHCPSGVFGNQRIGIVGELVQNNQIFRRSDVPQGDTNVPDESDSFESFDWRVPKKNPKLFVGQDRQLPQSQGLQLTGEVEPGLSRLGRKPVPRADFQAVVATVNPITDGRTEFDWNRALVLDGQIGDAPPGIQSIGVGNGTCRANIDTSGAGTAAVFGGGVWSQFEGGQNDAKEKPSTQSFIQADGALALPGETGEGGEVSLEDRPGIDVTFLSTALSLEISVNRNHVLQHDLVIIRSPGIAGDFPLSSSGTGALKIICGQYHYRFGLGQNPGRIGSSARITLEPSHLSLVARLQPGEKFLCVRRLDSARKSTIIKSMGLGQRSNDGFHFRQSTSRSKRPRPGPRPPGASTPWFPR